MKPATRFLIGGLAVVVLLTAVAVGAAVWQASRVAQTRLLQRLQTTAVVEAALQANRLQELQLRAEVLADDPAFVDYVAQSLIPNPQLGGAVDSASISDLLSERRHGYDVAMVLDPQGGFVAQAGTLLKSHASIRHDPLVMRTIATLKPVQGIWLDQGQLWWMAANPLLRGGTLQGVLITATHVDHAFAITIGRIAHSGVAFEIPLAAGAAPAPSSELDGWSQQALSTHLADILHVTAVDGQTLLLSDGRQATTTWVAPLDVSEGSAALVAIDPDAGAGHPIPATAWPLLCGLGGLGTMAALFILLLWWRTWLPLQRMLEVVQRAATGDSHLTVRVEGSPIVRCLRDGINPLLHTVRRPVE